jgi:hypothetical protein
VNRDVNDKNTIIKNQKQRRIKKEVNIMVNDRGKKNKEYMLKNLKSLFYFWINFLNIKM